MGSHPEIEHKFDAGSAITLPYFGTVEGVTAVTDPAEVALEAIYFDTADLRLAAQDTTLRRRTGGTDQGWHLKLPAGDAQRTEIRLPLNLETPLERNSAAVPEAAVPEALIQQVCALTRGRDLVPVAVLRTTRMEQHLLNSAGNVLAIVADDTVHAEQLADPSAEPATWREIEIELLDGDAKLLKAVSGLLESAGLTHSASASKLQRALGNVIPEPVAPPTLTARSAAGEVALAHVRAQIAELVTRDRGARADEPDAVHKMRVATRRLRSALATYRPLLDRTHTDPIRAELKWLGTALGQPRDAEVMHDRLRRLAQTQPVELLIGPVLRRIDLNLGTRHRDAHSTLLEALNDERYLRLLDSLDQLVVDPPVTKVARQRAQQALPRLVARACRRVDCLAQDAESAPTPERREELLHEVRKAAKRARYATESVAPVFGKPAMRLGKRMQHLQDVLGEHQDSVVARQVLRELGVVAHLSGENGFTFGLLHGLEHAQGENAQREYEPALRAASKQRVRRWTR